MGDKETEGHAPECDCPLHRLSKEERTKVIDAAIDQVNEEVRASGCKLPNDSDQPEEWGTEADPC